MSWFDQKNESGIKYKVILGFSLGMFALLMIGLLIYRSITQLSGSVNELAQPSAELNTFNNIILDLSKLEVHNWYYSVGSDTTRLDSLTNTLERMQSQIEELADSPNLPLNLKYSLTTVLRSMDNFPENLAEIQELKKQVLNTDFNEKAQDLVVSQITKFEQTPADTFKLEVDTVFIPNIPQPTPSLIPEEEIVEPEIDLSDFLTKKEIKKRKREERKKRRNKKQSSTEESPLDDSILASIPDNPVTELQINIDTTRFIKPDSVYKKKIKSYLVRLGQQEQSLENKLSEKELELIAYNTLIIEHVHSILDPLEKELQKIADFKKEKALIQSNETISIIATIVGICSLLMILFLIIISSDITKSAYYKQELIISKKKTEELASAKEAFLANMSHEIRTPLHAILGFSEHLQKEIANPAKKDAAEAIHKSSRHLLALVNDILDISKIEAQKLKLEEVNFSLQEILLETQRTFGIEAKSKGIYLHTHIPSALNQVLYGDPFRFKQVLFNLVSNAIKFTEKGGVDVQTQILGNTDEAVHLRMDIKDTGIGMTSTQQQKLFENFYQADAAITRKFGGSGLGLAISQKIVQQMEGEIQVESQMNQGSTFSVIVWFKKGDSNALPKEVNATDTRLGLSKSYRILIVDDDEINLKLCRKTLEKYHQNVFLAQRGKEALALLDKHDFDLLLVDMHMPEMSGIELVQKIRALSDDKKSHIPIVSLTANIFQKDLRSMLNAGADDYLTKPYREAELYEKLCLFLAKSDEPLSNHQNNDDQDMYPTYNLHALDQFTMGDEQLKWELIGQFLSESNDDIQLMAKYIAQKDWEELQALAHRMKSRFAQLEVYPTASLLRDIEMYLKQEVQLDQIPKLVKQVIQQSQRVLKDMETEYANQEINK